MNKHESFREYFRRARTDPVVRAQLLGNARRARRAFGWLVVLFGVLAFGQLAYQVWREGHWMSRLSFFFVFGFAVSWLIYDTFGARVAALARDEDLKSPGGSR